MKPFIVLLCTALSLLGQPATSEEDAGHIALEGTALAYFENVDRVLLRDGGEDGKAIGELRIPDTLFGPRLLVSVRAFEVGTLGEDGAFRRLGSVQLPDAGERFALIFAPTATGYRVFPIRVDDAKVNGGDTVVVNFTRGRIGAMLGEGKVVIEPMGNASVSPEVKGGKVAYTSTLAFEEKDGVGIFYKGRWAFNPNVKRLLFIFTDPKTKRPVHRMLTILAAD